MPTALAHSFVTQILRQLFDDSPLPIAIYDADGALVEANDAHNAFAEAIGNREGIGGRTSGSDGGRDRGPHHAQFLRALEGGNVDYSFHLEGDPEDEGQARQEFHRILLPGLDDEGRVVAVASVVVDVTEWLGAERDRARLQAQLMQAQKTESLGLLAGGIAHDFNNLLVGVLGNASLLLDELPAGSRLRPMVDAISLSAQRAADVASQLLAYAGKGRFRVETVELTELVRETAEVLRITVAGKGELHLGLAPGPTSVRVDATQLRQVVMNLITNARDALQDGGSITVRTGRVAAQDASLDGCLGDPDPEAAEFVYVEVQDTGCGIEPGAVDHIFDPFYTTKAAGRGLGLSAVLGVVGGHRGGLRVVSTPGQGTCVRVLLPAYRGADQAPVLAPPQEQPSAGQTATGGSILVVDDQPPVRKILRRMLKQLGYPALTASNGNEALTALTDPAAGVRCVLLDLSMPGEDGVQVFTRIRAKYPNLPVIFMSGYEVGSVPESEAFLHKPFELAKLRSVLREVLDPD